MHDFFFICEKVLCYCFFRAQGEMDQRILGAMKLVG